MGVVELNPKWSWVETESEGFSNALDKIFNTDENLFILGAGGVGKSILLKIVYDHFPNCLVLSSTGISASNLSVDGVPATTVHSALGLPPIELYNSLRPTENAVNLMTKTKLILIDEVSMIPASLMDYILMVSRYSSDFVKPRVIMFGDIFQLPPIKPKDPEVKKYYEKHYDGNYFFFNSKRFNKMKFKTIHLTEVHRQKDQEFVEALNRIRVGLASDEDIEMINTRVISDKEKFLEDNPMTLYLATTNRQVNHLNDEYSRKFSDFRNYFCEINGNVDLKDFPNVLESVRIAEGQQVMCLANNWEAGYQNGTLGIVEKVFPERVLIRMTSGQRTFVEFHSWKKYEYKYDEEKDEVTHVEVGSMTQIGCKPAFAVTFHKSQGLSLDSIIVDLSSSFVPESGVYLALSRCRTLEGIGLTRPITQFDIKVNPEALEFLAENYVEELF